MRATLSPRYEAIRSRSGPQTAVQDTIHTRFAFFALCLYLLSQAYEIPILAVGPSWSVWPVLSDIAVGFMAISWIMSHRFLRIRTIADSSIYQALVIVFVSLCTAFILADLRSTLTSIKGIDRGASFGIFQIYRMIQFLLVFRVASGIPLNPKRVAIMSYTAGAALILAFIGIVGTYTGFLPTQLLVSQLPGDINSCGPWISLSNSQWFEAGTIGYNHSYTSVQLLMLAALALGLQLRRNTFLNFAYLFMAGVGVFLTGSRAGMAAAVIFVLSYFLRKPVYLAVAVIAFALMFSASSGWLGDLNLGLGATTERQLTLRDPVNPENLSGRAEIWRESLEFLQEDPVRWIVGAGPGFIAQFGSNAHMLYLHLIIEGGIIGLLMFCFAIRRMIKALYEFELGEKPIFWVTIALLISSFTQETLYPVPAMGHFLGLFFCSIALAVNIGVSSRRWARTREVT